MNDSENSPERTPLTRRKLLRTLGVGATTSAIGGRVLTGTAAAHDLEIVFPSCREVLVVVNDRSEFGTLRESIHVFDADTGEIRSVGVELTPENTKLMRDRFGDRPVFSYTVSGNETILAVRTGDGRRFENPNDCPGPQPPAEPTGFAIEQGDRCIPLTPLSYQNVSIEEFYGNQPDPKQSNTPTNLERPATSILFLYRGPGDQIGLVMIHGAPGGPGGAASFSWEGAPDPGPSVFDDSAAPVDSEDRLSCGGADECFTEWAWDEANDGAAWSPLNREFNFQITPGFNEEASLDVPSGGGVERWQVLSGDARNPDRFDLALDQPVTLRTGSC